MASDQATSPRHSEVPIVVENFLRYYSFEHYECLAQRVENKLKKRFGELKNEERLQPWATAYRAKTRESLREKVMVRHSEVNFSSTEQIKKDMWDLAGVRVILYFPSDDEHSKVRDIIRKIWREENIETRNHKNRVQHSNGDRGAEKRTRRVKHSSIHQPIMVPENGGEYKKTPKQYEPRNVGYTGIHYICQMEATQEDRPRFKWKYEVGDQVEIQVVSALTHAWATAGHDLLYKSSLFGEPTPEEHRVYDALNGLIQSGDLLLEQFQSMVHGRTYRPFESPHELGVHLGNADVLQDLKEKPMPPSEGLEILLRFLRHPSVGKDCPFKLRGALKRLGYPTGIVPKKSIDQFQPKFECVHEMELVVCLFADNLPTPDPNTSSEDLASDKLCRIMMSALKLLQSFFPLPEEANAYLRSLQLDSEEKISMDFVLSSSNRQIILAGDGNEDTDTKDLRPAWKWFKKQTNDASSICGLVFRVAEMEILGEVKFQTLLDDLKIGSLSRSSTTETEEFFEDTHVSPDLGY
ncbi:uncharacterized protein CC84DRAFT_1176683 [Paraphaeosphaeria sporulosa]|uniref:RelA/SpoT domain-containing protein n=1 Tax=Paraphaeosphaeria sporulosa TaxID=1460663 RepID=A0A177CCD6_9PLEO|nr:uncharacterized protein CC84DRAFT_1176683 [Paraphaeosphaeria sporulosa]OAG04469.1 hypothetical protein CC84DRAFT_1176683 [Paraphaeosphaeria sporulosa]